MPELIILYMYEVAIPLRLCGEHLYRKTSTRGENWLKPRSAIES